MKESLSDGRVVLHVGDCLTVLAEMAPDSIDAVVTDPPYHLLSTVKRFAKTGGSDRIHNGQDQFGRLSRGFMGKEWDGGDVAFRPETWAAVARVLKPGGHLVAFSAPKCQHRMVCAIEDAGFEIRDGLMWLFGTGFPKSHDVSKGIDKAAGAEREKVAIGAPVKRMIPGADQHKTGWERNNGREYQPGIELPATDAARRWEGWGTALKPAYEPICLARKPLIGTVVENVLRHGTGAINVDGCRIDAQDKAPAPIGQYGGSSIGPNGHSGIRDGSSDHLGRWPANVCHDGSDEVVAMFPASKGQQGDVRGTEASHTGDANTVCYGEFDRVPFSKRGDSGSAARFFYSAKASKADRAGSKHPTVKPIDLMRWLVRMVTPPARFICENCNGNRASETMRTVRDDVQTSTKSETRQADQVLQQDVCGLGNEAVSKELHMVQQTVHAEGIGAEILRKTLRAEVDGEESQNDEGFRDLKEGVSAAVDAGASTGEAAEGIHIRASVSGGAPRWTPSDEQGSGSSQEWRQDGQPAGELRADAEAGSRQAQSSSSEHANVSSLRRTNNHEQTCPHCMRPMTWYVPRVLDPFAGTGTTGEAAWREGFRAILIEREAEYCADIRRRMNSDWRPIRECAERTLFDAL